MGRVARSYEKVFSRFLNSEQLRLPQLPEREAVADLKRSLGDVAGISPSNLQFLLAAGAIADEEPLPYQEQPQSTTDTQLDKGTCPFEGTWDVQITETSDIGSSQYSVVLCVHGASATFADHSDGSDWRGHFSGASWMDIVLKEASGCTQKFVGTQRMPCAPMWAGVSATVCGAGEVRGDLSSSGMGTFRATMTIASRRGDTLQLRQDGVMTRRQQTN